jgi:hypothetical protein
MDYRLKLFLALLAAIVVTTALGSIFQSQHTMAAMSEIGPPIAMGDRLATTFHDLARFAPLYFLIVAPTFLVAFLVAELLAIKLPPYRLMLILAASVVGLWTAFPLVDQILMPATMITATRTGGGTALMVLGGLFGGIVYALLTRNLSIAKRPPQREAYT